MLNHNALRLTKVLDNKNNNFNLIRMDATVAVIISHSKHWH